MEVKTSLHIKDNHKLLLQHILKQFIPHVSVWAYGSRVKGTHHEGSDLDLVVFTTPDQRTTVSDLREALEESDIPFIVDLHRWDEIPDTFREIVRSGYVVIQEGQEESASSGTTG